MNIQQLTCFIAASTCNSFSIAAKKNYMSQPNFSKNIKSLEKELGVTLFHRTNKGVVLTPEGKELTQHVSSIISQLEALTKYYSDRKGEQRKITISSLPISSVIDAIGSIRNNNIDLVIQFIETNRQEVIKNIMNNTCELGFLMTSSLDPYRFNDIFKDNHLKYVILKEDYCNVYFNKNHPLAHKKELTYNDLKPYKKIIFNLDSFTENSFTVKNEYTIITNSVSFVKKALHTSMDYLVQTQWDKDIFLDEHITCCLLKEESTKAQIGYTYRNDYQKDKFIQKIIEQVCYNINE